MAFLRSLIAQMNSSSKRRTGSPLSDVDIVPLLAFDFSLGRVYEGDWGSHIRMPDFKVSTKLRELHKRKKDL